jgi:hypothetical protein
VTVTPLSSVTTVSVDVSEEDMSVDIEDSMVELAVGSTGASVEIPGTVGLAPEQQGTKISLKKSLLIFSIKARVLYD